ncbi:carboxypeptidase-like regulatory domain-containing protein [Hymenobacter saemangeumensis]
MTPTEAGRYCAACQTEVVDFTRMSEEEVLAYLAARQGQRVCGAMYIPVVEPAHQLQPRGVHGWLLALAALVGWHSLASCASKPPQVLPQASATFQTPTASQQQVTIRGQVIDDTLNRPLRGAYVFIAGTEYGTITDAQGNFTLSFPADWEPVRSGEVHLEVPGIAYMLQGATVKANLAGNPEPGLLAIRLPSSPDRGRLKGKPVPIQPPKPLSELGKK